MRRINALIVDDERLARQRILRFLSQEADIDVAGQCANVRELSQAFRDKTPDVLFLDVQMPNSDVFEFLRSLAARPPVLIFVTAYEYYAVRAFECEACDYLLKPVQEDRFRSAIQRARVSLAGAWRDQPEENSSTMDAVMVPGDGKVSILRTESIDWIETEGNYVRLHAGKEAHVVRETISSFEVKLKRAGFARIHRSRLVNLARVIEFQHSFNGDLNVVLQNGKQLRMSRNYRERVQDIVGRSL